MILEKPIPFWKLSGSGNDFILIDHRKMLIPEDKIAHFISKVCRRALSVGADGVILIEASKEADYKWHYYNADGGEAEMCANGSRCAARFAVENKIAPRQHSFETLAGIVRAELLPEKGEKDPQTGRVRVHLPDPFDLQLNVKMTVNKQEKIGHIINTGVPHVIYFVEDVDRVDLISLGRETRYHTLFSPNGTNVNFVSLCGPHRLKIRTYERGVENETLACGTGSIAAALITTALKKASPPFSIITQSGIVLGVDFTSEQNAFKNISLEGDARIIYKGKIETEALF
ncbi:MAG: diaminopimelate epimerase [Nitrospiria bacterium]